MGRWQPDSRGRLVEAALDLFAERGFDQTTAAQIAARAGLTERTFFRYFADKREVLFGGHELRRERVATAVAGAPATDGALAAVARGLEAAAEMLGGFRRDLARRRLQVITANPELRERELAKLDDIASAVADALCARGVPTGAALMAAESASAVLRIAVGRWVDLEDDRALRKVVHDTLADLRAVLGGA